MKQFVNTDGGPKSCAGARIQLVEHCLIMNQVDDVDANDVDYDDDEKDLLRSVGFGGGGGWVVTADSGQQTPMKLTKT